MATVAGRHGLRQRLDLLAPLPAVDPSRRVATVAWCVVENVGVGGRDRLEPRRHRSFERRGKKGGDPIGPTPTDKGKAGSKRHLVVDAQGIPLAVRLSGANRNDCQLFEDMLDAIPPLKKRGRGRPRRRPTKAHADKGSDHL